jgi:hypothetical protein
MQIRNAQHARLRMVAPDINYGTATEVFWDGNSAYAASGALTLSLPPWSAQLNELLLPTASSDVDLLLCSLMCVSLLS